MQGACFRTGHDAQRSWFIVDQSQFSEKVTRDQSPNELKFFVSCVLKTLDLAFFNYIEFRALISFLEHEFPFLKVYHLETVYQSPLLLFIQRVEKFDLAEDSGGTVPSLD